jgi:hypothetical protein
VDLDPDQDLHFLKILDPDLDCIKKVPMRNPNTMIWNSKHFLAWVSRVSVPELWMRAAARIISEILCLFCSLKIH